MARFRVGYSAYLTNQDGSKAFPSYDLARLGADPAFELVEMPRVERLTAEIANQYDAVVMLLEQMRAEAFAPGGRLALIARMGVGYDTIDVPAATAADVCLTITPEAVRRPMAVTIATFVLALAGRLFEKDRIARGGAPVWPQRMLCHGTGLVGRTFGAIGMGNIGAEAFRMLRPFGLRFIAHDPYVDPAVAAELGVELVDLDEVFRQADFVSLSCPLNDQTRHICNARRLALMKPTAYLINTARGPVADQKALHAALSEGRIAGAALDVFDPEPPPADEPILRLDNVICAPHALGWTDQMFATMAEVNMAAIRAVAAGRVPVDVVNPAVLEQPGFRAKLARSAG